MEIEVYNIQGQKTDKKVTLSDTIFGIEPNSQAIYMATRQYMNNRRSGNHSTKERNAIVGSTVKIKRQKGTGTARAGSIKSPLFRGGGRIFGPSPRDYSFRLNKKLKRLARRSALSAKVKDGELMVLEDFKMDQPKTKEFANILKSLSLQETKTLLIVTDLEHNMMLSSRNIPGVKVRRADSLNTYELLDNKKVLVMEGSLKVIEEQLVK
ncbi:MAG TPA: 50S ribosomal protein L4 [Bacteroidales bacterium]|nr:50S ribosomal protein L4 [Bacteroidales bacterium]